MDFAKIEKLMELMRKHGMQEVSIADEKEEIRITAPAAPTMPFHMASIPAMATVQNSLTHPVASAAPTEASPANQAVRNATATGKMIKSPFVGTFYRSSQPGSQPFVSVGQRVKKGEVLCIVEAMKMMNEIESEVDGVIKEILVENEHPVEFDQPLFIVE